MTITNYKNQYLRITSDRFKNALANIPDYAGFFHVTGKIGCNGTSYTEKINFPFVGDNLWVTDATQAVQLENSVYSLKVKNFHSLVEYEVLTTPIDLGYVADNCTDPSGQCELGDGSYPAYFAPLFKSQIDDYFAGLSIASDVTVTFSGNFINIFDLPEGFIMSSIGYNNVDNEETIDTMSFYRQYLNQDPEDLNPINFFADSNGDLLIHWKFFDEVEGVDDALIDGVYNIHLKYEYTSEEYSGGGWETEEMCAFIDIETKCLVAAKITELLSGVSTNGENAHLMHYALINGSNCGCNCTELCALYTELLTLIKDSTVQDCGC